MEHLLRTLATEAPEWMSIRKARNQEWIKLTEENLDKVIERLEKKAKAAGVE